MVDIGLWRGYSSFVDGPRLQIHIHHSAPVSIYPLSHVYQCPNCRLWLWAAFEQALCPILQRWPHTEFRRGIRHWRHNLLKAEARRGRWTVANIQQDICPPIQQLCVRCGGRLVEPSFQRWRLSNAKLTIFPPRYLLKISYSRTQFTLIEAFLHWHNPDSLLTLNFVLFVTE